MSKDIPNIGGDRPHGRIVITYGTFDVLHQGHINLLRRAKELGDWLIVGVTTDNFDLERGKMNTRDSVMKRVQAVKETGYVDEVIIEEYKGQKIDDIQKYNVDVFAIGSDWEGYFDYLKEYCEVVYLPGTQGISSTMLREEQISVRIGIIGTGSIAVLTEQSPCLRRKRTARFRFRLDRNGKGWLESTAMGVTTG